MLKLLSQFNYELQSTLSSVKYSSESNPVGTVPLISLHVKCISTKYVMLPTQSGIGPDN